MIFITFAENLRDDPGQQYTVTFAAGVTRVLFDAQIITQIVIRDNKYYQLTINNSILPTGVTTYHPDKASLIAIDNCKYIYCHVCIELCSLIKCMWFTCFEHKYMFITS